MKKGGKVKLYEAYRTFHVVSKEGKELGRIMACSIPCDAFSGFDNLVSFAFCSPNDLRHYNRAKGKVIAFNRALCDKTGIVMSNPTLDLIKVEIIYFALMRGIKWMSEVAVEDIK